MPVSSPSQRLLAARARISLRRAFRYFETPDRDPAGVSPGPGEVIVELVFRGAGALRVDREWIPVQPGDMLWHRPGHVTIGRSDHANPYACLAVYLGIPAGFRAHAPRISRGLDPAAVGDFARELGGAMSEDERDLPLLRDFVVTRLAFWLHQAARRARRRELPASLQAVLAWIEQEPTAHRYRLPDLARIAGWSGAHLHEMFRLHLGTTPHRWVLQHRLRVARVRLAETNDPIKKIAVECGFRDASAFIPAFRAATGTTPAAYRRAHRGSPLPSDFRTGPAR